jgi:hypothetical protein
MALALSTMAVFGTAGGLVTVVLLAVWFSGAISIVMCMVAAAPGKQEHFLTHGVWKTLTEHRCPSSQGGVANDDARVGQDKSGKDGQAAVEVPHAKKNMLDGTGGAPKNTLSVPVTGIQERLNRFKNGKLAAIFAGCLGSRKPNASEGDQRGSVASPSFAAAAGTFNPYFVAWSAGMCLKVEVNDIEGLDPHSKPEGSVTPAKGVGLRVTEGDRGSDVSLVIAPDGADGETPDACVLKGVKGRATAVVTETEHVCLHTATGTKQLLSNQAGTGLWFHSWWNKGDVLASRTGDSVVLKATSVPISSLSAIFPMLFRFRVLKADALQAPEEVRLYCHYASGHVRILQVLMQLVPESCRN